MSSNQYQRKEHLERQEHPDSWDHLSFHCSENDGIKWSYVTCYGKRDHMPHFVKIEIILLLNCAFNADRNGIFDIAMRCSVAKIWYATVTLLLKHCSQENAFECCNDCWTCNSVYYTQLRVRKIFVHAHTRAVSARFHTTCSFSL